MISIIMPIIYRADLARVAIDSIKNYTSIPYELICVQEGEDNEVTNLLKEQASPFLQNKKPLGFSGAMNTGLSKAKGDYVCFINSDIVATPGWLEKILDVFSKDKMIGLVAPTNTDVGTIHSVDRNNGKEFEVVDNPLTLKGVCFVIKKEVLDKVGKWDESFGLGGGDDNDMCLRIAKAGYKLAVARKSYIYHYGSASFREEFNNDIDYSKRFSVGQFNKLRNKHGIDKDKPKVFIAIPTVNGYIHYKLIYVIIKWMSSGRYNIKFNVYENISPVDASRNQAVKDFLEDYYDYILFIDNDIIPPENALDELLKADKDVIAPVCFTIRQDDNGLMAPTIVANRYAEDGAYRPHFGKGIEEVDFITGGMHLVKREVMEKLERPYSFIYNKNGTICNSEDVVFSKQCQELGYKLYTVYGILCGHYKIINVKDYNDILVGVSKNG